MTAFLYFIGGPDKPVTLADAERAGIGYAFDADPPCSFVERSPSGKPGMLCWGPALRGGAGYEPDAQEWLPLDDAGRVHVGVCKGRLPTPDTLAQPRQLTGRLVRLGDGHEWQIPTLGLCQSEGYGIALPRRAKRVAGQWTWTDVAAEYQSLEAMFERLFDAIYQAGEMTEARAIDDLCELVSWNYRVTAAECELLGLIQQDSLYAALQSAMDFETTAEWIKKKLTDETPTATAG